MIRFLSYAVMAILFAGCAFSSTTETGSSSTEETEPSSFEIAVTNATEAAELTQTASTESDWQEVASLWNSASLAMGGVPSSDPNYELAQEKEDEYRDNERYAQMGHGQI